MSAAENNPQSPHKPTKVDPPLDVTATGDPGQPASSVQGHIIVNMPAGVRPLTEPLAERIGPYKLLQPLGEGGFGTVFMAEQMEPVKRRVALKVIKLGMDTKNVIARFEAERQALALMDHPNIAKVFDAGATENGRPYFVMELVRGIPITTYCDEHKFTPMKRLELFTQVCSAIQHAHQKGIIHRDLKPSNILVAEQDGKAVPKVIDFGIAKATEQRLTDKTLVTQLQAFIGTPAYCSPEQMEMSALDIDTRSDIYSLGVLLYELLTGKPPFDSKRLREAGLDEMRRMIREEEPPRPSTRLSTLADADRATVAKQRGTEPVRLTLLLKGDLDWILMKALEKDRSRRYETANSFAQDVNRYLDNEAVLACPPSMAYMLTKLARRHKLAVTMATVLVATILLGAAVSTWQAVRAMRAESRADEEKNKAIDERDRARTAEKIARDERIKAEKAEAKANSQRDAAVAERLRADEQAAISKAVNDFLQNDLLLQADSENQANRGFKQMPDLTVKEALRRASETVGERFTNRPLVEAEIRTTLGSALNGVGESSSAIPHFERALALQSGLRGPDHPETLESMHKLAVAFREAGRLKDSLQLFEDTLRLRKVKLGVDDADTLNTMNSLGVAYDNAGQRTNAIRLYEDVLRIKKAQLGPDDPSLLTSIGNLAVAYHDSGRDVDALPLFEDVYKLKKAKLGADHPSTLLSMGNLAVAYGDAGRPSDALRLNEEAVEFKKARLGPSHPSTITSMNNLASAYDAAGRSADAMRLYEDAFRLAQAKLGTDHPITLSAMNNLAVAYNDAGRLKDAMPLYEDALRRRKTKFGPDHTETLASMHNLAVTYRKAGRLSDAVLLFENALMQRKAKLGPDHPDTLSTMNSLAVAYSSAGRFLEAVQLHEETLKLKKSKLGPEHPSTLTTKSNLRSAYRNAIQSAESKGEISKAADWMRKLEALEKE